MSANVLGYGVVDELRGYWRGEGPLWRLYWIYGVLVSTTGGAILSAVAVNKLINIYVFTTFLAAALVYTGFILISTWRCAFNISGSPLGMEREMWGWLARILTFGWAINAGGAVVMLLQYMLDY